jgi:SAM-dependent methyltransferase
MIDDTRRWEAFFDDHLKKYHSLLEYAVAYWNDALPVYYHIRQIVPVPAKLLEIGCGMGISAIYLQECGYQVTAVDNNANIVKRAQETAQYFRSNILIQCADAFDLSQYYGIFDLVYSLGVLEHFDREITIQLLREQAQCGRYVVIGVPSRFTKPLTDERIYTLRQLRHLMREAGLTSVKSFGYGNPSELIKFRRLLPHALYRILQDYFSLAQGLVVIGQSSSPLVRIW